MQSFLLLWAVIFNIFSPGIGTRQGNLCVGIGVGYLHGYIAAENKNRLEHRRVPTKSERVSQNLLWAMIPEAKAKDRPKNLSQKDVLVPAYNRREILPVVLMFPRLIRDFWIARSFPRDLESPSHKNAQP